MGENLFSVNRPLYNYFLLIETQKKKKKKLETIILIMY
jgi:hypothetical protein